MPGATVKTTTVEALAWALIFAGAVLLGWGLFALRRGVGWGGVLTAAGAAASVAGAVLIVVRSRMRDPRA